MWNIIKTLPQDLTLEHHRGRSCGELTGQIIEQKSWVSSRSKLKVAREASGLPTYRPAPTIRRERFSQTTYDLPQRCEINLISASCNSRKHSTEECQADITLSKKTNDYRLTSDVFSALWKVTVKETSVEEWIMPVVIEDMLPWCATQTWIEETTESTNTRRTLYMQDQKTCAKFRNHGSCSKLSDLGL